MDQHFLPEGQRLNTPENQRFCADFRALHRARAEGCILEGRALLCDAEHNLQVQVGPFTGTIPREQAALGIAEGTTRDIAILSRVGKPVCFMIDEISGCESSPTLLLSRRRAQQAALDHIMFHWKPGLIVPVRVTHLEPFGVFVDVGCGVVSMIGIENLSVSRIPHPCCRVSAEQELFALVTALDREAGRIFLSHKQLLGTWQENAAAFAPGITVPGRIRGIKDYGIFVELSANLSGLAEYKEGLQEGDRVCVFIKAIQPERHKIKLRIVERLPYDSAPPPLRYFETEGVLEQWQYIP